MSLRVWLDARIPVRFGTPDGAGAGEAVLLSAGTPPPPDRTAAWMEASRPAAHPPGCACCRPRGAAAQALGALFLRRARGEVPAFTAVVVAVGGAEADEVRVALRDDPLVSARYRLG